MEIVLAFIVAIFAAIFIQKVAIAFFAPIVFLMRIGEPVPEEFALSLLFGVIMWISLISIVLVLR